MKKNRIIQCHDLIGHLSVKLENDKQNINWTWQPNGGQICEGPVSRIKSNCQEVLERMHLALSGILTSPHKNSMEQVKLTIKSLSDNLKEQFIPGEVEAFLMNKLGKKGDFLTVDVTPDGFPLELLLIDNVPFSVYYRTMHLKRLKADICSDRGTKRSDISILRPKICMTEAITNNIPDELRPRIEEHLEKLDKYLEILYSPQKPHLSSNSDVTVDRFKQVLASNYDLLYHIGHGGFTKDGGMLELNGGQLPATELESHLKRNGNSQRGLAFVNSCWSAATSLSNAPDIAHALLAGGFHAVIGTVLAAPIEEIVETAEEFFHNIVDKRFDLVESLYSIQNESWERLQNNEYTNLPWVYYRLYGSLQKRFLTTSITKANGAVVIPCGISGSDIEVGSLTEQGETYLTSEELKYLLEINHSRKERGLGAIICEVLNNNSLNKVGKKLISAIFASGSIELWNKFAGQDFQQFIINADKLRKINEKEVTSSHMFFAVNDWNHFQTNQYQTPIPIHLSTEAIDLVADAVQDAKGSQIQFKNFFSAIQRIPQIDMVFTGGKGITSPDVEEFLRLARFFARGDNRKEINEIDIFQSAITEAINIAVSLKKVKHTAGHIILPAPNWNQNDDIIAEAPNKDEVAIAAKGHLNFAKACQAEERNDENPFWFHVLKSCLINDFHGFRDALKNINVDASLLWQVIEKRVCMKRAPLIVPSLCKAGKPVGISLSTLPNTICWDSVLNEAALGVSQGKRRVILTVPWKPGDESPQARWMNDVICSAIMEKAAKVKHSTIKEKIWMHFPAMELINAQRTIFKNLLFRRATTPINLLKNIFIEAKEKSVLCLKQVEEWIEPSGKSLKPEAGKLIDKIIESQLPMIALICRSDLAGELAYKKGFAEKVRELPRLSSKLLEDFLIEAGNQLFRTPMEDQEFKIAVRAVIKEAGKFDENARLLRCLELLWSAYELGGSENKWPEAIISAINYERNLSIR